MSGALKLEAGGGPRAWRRALKGGRDYAYTLLLSVGTTFALLLVFATLARMLDESQFYAFTVFNRYLAFLAIVGNLGVAFAFIRSARDLPEPEMRRLAGIGRRCIDLAVLGVFVPWTIYVGIRSGGIDTASVLQALAFVWVYSQATYNLTAPLARAEGGMREYTRNFLNSRLLPAFAGLAAAALSKRFEAYFIAYGLASLLAQRRLWRHVPRSMPRDEAKRLIAYSSSRWTEAMLRAFLPVLLIVSTDLFVAGVSVGAVAIVYTLAKTMESLLQPLVVAAMMRTGASVDGERGLVKSVAVAALVSGAAALAHWPVTTLVGVLLGARYAELGHECWLVLLGTGPLIGLHLLRAFNDNRFQTSPMLAVNLVSVAYIPLACLLVDDLSGIAISVAVLQVLRYAIYARAVWAGASSVPSIRG